MNDQEISEVWREHYPRVVRTAYFLTGNREDAEELAQDAFVAAVGKWMSGHLGTNAERWLQLVVRRQAISFLRRKRFRDRNRRPIRTEVAEQEPTIIEPALVEAIRQLPQSQRAAFVVRYYLGYSVEDAARLLRKRPGTVRALTSQATKRVRAEVQHDDSEARHRGRA